MTYQSNVGVSIRRVLDKGCLPYVDGKGLWLKTDTTKTHVTVEIGLCAQNIDTFLGSIYVLGRSMWIAKKRNIMYSLTSYKFCMSRNLK